MVNRENGHYWITYAGDRMVARWTDDVWEICASDNVWYSEDPEIYDINENRIIEDNE